MWGVCVFCVLWTQKCSSIWGRELLYQVSGMLRSSFVRPSGTLSNPSHQWHRWHRWYLTSGKANFKTQKEHLRNINRLPQGPRFTSGICHLIRRSPSTHTFLFLASHVLFNTWWRLSLFLFLECRFQREESIWFKPRHMMYTGSWTFIIQVVIRLKLTSPYLPRVVLCFTSNLTMLSRQSQTEAGPLEQTHVIAKVTLNLFTYGSINGKSPYMNRVDFQMSLLKPWSLQQRICLWPKLIRGVHTSDECGRMRIWHELPLSLLVSPLKYLQAMTLENQILFVI